MIKLLKNLIDFQSVTPESNGCIEYIADLLEQNGFKTEIKIFGKNDYFVSNLYATYGNTRPNICFAGHVDVVPPGDKSLWFCNPFNATIIDGKMYGRGAVDMKGAIACFLTASFDFIKLFNNPNGAISLLITSDEEGKATYGTVEMLKYLHQECKKYSSLIDLAIVGEPTNEQQIGDTVKIGRRGSANFTLNLYGITGHVAYPLEANNPIPGLVAILNELINSKLDEGSKFFQPSNLEITSIDVGNNVTNVIPLKVTVKFNIRFNDRHSPPGIVNLIDKIINQYCNKYKLEYELTNIISADCFIQEPSNLIADFVQIVADTTKVSTKLSTTGGTSDARFIRNYCPVVEYGLKSSMAHKINEYTEISDLQSLYLVYYNTLVKFLK